MIIFHAGAIEFLPTSKEKSTALNAGMNAFPARMTELSAIICPDSSVPEERLKAILSFFGSVKIGWPWFMDQPVPFSQSGAVQILHPPEDLKPSGDFRGLLAEYRRWIRTSHETGFDAFLAFKEQKLHGEEATWEIRGELRRKKSQSHDARRQDTLKWHLFLHLAHEIEEEGREAEELLRTLKEKDSPLKGVIEEEESPGPVSDLPESEGSLILSEAGMKQVLEAWFSLFEGRLSEQVVLLTLSPPIFQHLCDAWEEWGGGSAWAEMEFRVPDFSRLDLQELFEAKGRFLNSREGVALREAVLRFLKGNSGVSKEKMDGINPEGLTGQVISIRLRRLSLLERSSVNEIVRYLSGKTIGLIREGHAYGQ